MLGLGMTLHAVPFQCSVSVLSENWDWVLPTAQTSFDPITATALRALLKVPGLGLATTLHAVPSKCSLSVAPRLPRLPTAQLSLGPAADTPCNWLFALGLGLATTLHAVPFQCSTNVA